jgi:hypothetical protein
VDNRHDHGGNEFVDLQMRRQGPVTCHIRHQNLVGIRLSLLLGRCELSEKPVRHAPNAAPIIPPSGNSAR